MENNQNTENVQLINHYKEKPHWLLWWKVQNEEIQRQVDNYKTYKIYQSAKGISLLLVLLSLGLTAAAFSSVEYDLLNFIDIYLLVLFGLFTYMGHRWAMIAAMVLWTIEKGFGVYTTFDITGKPNAFGLFMQVVFWCLYMKYFYLSFKVEQARKKLTK